MDKCTIKSGIFDCLMDRARLSDCLLRGYSSIIIKDDSVVGTGHSFVPYGEKCGETGVCKRKVLQKEFQCQFDFYEVCPIIHAEMSAILSCGKLDNCAGASLYLLGINQHDTSVYKDAFPCSLCLRHIILVGITRICIVQNEYYCHEFLFGEDGFQ